MFPLIKAPLIWLLLLLWPFHTAAVAASGVNRLSHFHRSTLSSHQSGQPVSQKVRAPAKPSSNDCARTIKHYGITPIRCLNAAAHHYHHHDGVEHHHHDPDDASVVVAESSDTAAGDRTKSNAAKRVTAGELDTVLWSTIAWLAPRGIAAAVAKASMQFQSHIPDPPERPPRQHLPSRLDAASVQSRLELRSTPSAPFTSA